MSRLIICGDGSLLNQYTYWKPTEMEEELTDFVQWVTFSPELVWNERKSNKLMDQWNDHGNVSPGEEIWYERNGVGYHAVVKDVDHAAETVTLIESRKADFTDTSQVKLSFREILELGFKMGRQKARTIWHHNQLYIMDSMHSSLSYNWQYFWRKSNTLRYIKNKKSYDNCNRPLGTKRPSLTVLVAMFVAAAMLPYIVLLVGNLTSVQRTYRGLWRPNELCHY